ncbi:MAG: 50S ribosomal protein L34 [Phycisphaerae bacterium]
MENHRISKVKKKRKSGFLTRMRTKTGRNIMKRRRRIGRSLKLRNT